MKRFLISKLIGYLNNSYEKIKDIPAENRVVMLSRQGDSESIDFRLLREELERRGIKVTVLCRRFAMSIGSLKHTLKQMKYLAASKVAVIDSYCIPVSVLKHKDDLKVIQIWHAVAAVKKFGKATVGKEEGSSPVVAESMHMHENYTYITAPSVITAGHFGEGFGYGPESFVKLGLPRIDYIVKEDNSLTEEIRRHYGLDNGKKTILYAPTFRRKTETDYRSLVQSIDTDRYDLVIRLHPLDKTKKEETEGVIFADEYGTYDLLKAADIVITDYSALVVEASLLDKPLYLYTYDIYEYGKNNGLNIDFEEEPIGKYRFEDAKELANCLDEEYDLEALRSFRDRYIEIEPGECTEQMADFITGLLDGTKGPSER